MFKRIILSMTVLFMFASCDQNEVIDSDQAKRAEFEQRIADAPSTTYEIGTVEYEYYSNKLNDLSNGIQAKAGGVMCQGTGWYVATTTDPARTILVRVLGGQAVITDLRDEYEGLMYCWYWEK